MAYVSPKKMLDVQKRLVDGIEEAGQGPDDVTANVIDFIETCAVCGEHNCSKGIVYANGVYVHPADVKDANRVDKPRLEEK